MTGAGTYDPDTSTPNFVEPNGLDITKTISRVEMTAITAAILHNLSRSANGSLSYSCQPIPTCCSKPW